MRISLVKLGENRGAKSLLAILVVMLMLTTPFFAMAGNSNRDSRSKPDLGIAEFYTNETRPEDGEPITITMVVKNYGDEHSVEARLVLFEDSVMEDPIETWDITPLTPGSEFMQGYTYDTTGKRGTRFFYVKVDKVMPMESNSTYWNNNGTLEINIFRDQEGFDKIYENNEISVISGKREYHGFHALYDNSKVTIEEDNGGVCDVVIEQDDHFQFGIIVSGNSRLDIRDCTMYSDYKFYITVSKNGMLTIENSNLTNATIRSADTNVSSSLTIMDSEIYKGGIGGVDVNWNTIESSHIEGSFVFNGGNVTIEDSEFMIPEGYMAEIVDTSMEANEIAFHSNPYRDIIAKGESNVVLKKVWDMGDTMKQTIGFDAVDDSRVEIYREVEIHAKDTTDLPVDGASINVYFEDKDNPQNLYTTGVTDEIGNVTFTLLSDILVEGLDGYRGNYEIVGIFTDDRSVTHEAFLTHRLANKHNFKYNDTYDKIDLIFEPIPPKVCDNPYKPTGTLYNGASLAYSGCIQITSVVKYVNSTIEVIQDKNFQSAIYIEGSGQLILENTTIWSNKMMNIYVIGSTAYLKGEEASHRSGLRANALVGVDGNVQMDSVNISANIRGTYKGFNVGSGSVIRGTWLTEAASMAVYDTDIYSDEEDMTSVVRGGSLSIGGNDFYINHFELNSTSLSAIQNADMWGNTLAPDESPENKRWFKPGSSLVLSSEGNCQVIGSDVNYDIFDISCKAFNAEKSNFNRDIIYGEEATSGSLVSVDAPSVQVLGDATVSIYFIVSFEVENSLGGPIADAPISITRMGGGGKDKSTTLQTTSNGWAETNLLAEEVTTGNNHEWMGNYKVVVEGCTQADPKEFSVGGGQGDQHYPIRFDACVPDIEGLHYAEVGLNRTMVKPPNNDITLSGQVRVTYTGGITLPPSQAMDVEITLPSSGDVITTETDFDGNFEVVFDMMNYGLEPMEQLVFVNATYVNPKDMSDTYTISETLNVTVLPEKPEKIFQPEPYPAIPGDNSLTDKDMYESRENIVVSGKATYDTGTPIPSGSTVQIQIIGTEIMASGVTGSDGRFSIMLNSSLAPGKEKTYLVMTKVTATHPYYNDLVLNTQKQDVILVQGQKDEEGGDMMLWLIIVIVIIVIAVAVVGLLWFFKYKSFGTQVECGECGAFIPENASKCPKCGTEFETEVVKCSECEAWIPALATECPKCGVEFKRVEEEEETPPGKPGAPGTQQGTGTPPPPPKPVVKPKAKPKG